MLEARSGWKLGAKRSGCSKLVLAAGQANTFGSLEIGYKDAYAAICFSEDGISWSRVAHDPELFGDWDNDLAAQTVRSLTTFGDLVVAVGDLRVHSTGQMLRDSRQGPAVSESRPTVG